MNDPHENATWVYNYDRGGNITSKVQYAYTTGTLGTILETVLYTYGDSSWKDKLTAYNGKTITYDEIGNPLNDDERTYTWGAGRQLRHISMLTGEEHGFRASNGVHEDSNTRLRIVHDEVNSKLKAKLLHDGRDITDERAASAFVWTKNGSAAGTGKEIVVTDAEVNGDVQFSCTYTETQGVYGTVSADNNLVVSHTPATADANHVFSLENSMLKVEIPNNAGNGTDYELIDGVLSVNPGFTGAITAEYEFITSPTREIDFAYDHNGLRTRKKVVENGITTICDYTLHGKLITHLTKRTVDENGAESTEELHFFYDTQSRPAKVSFGGVLYTYIHNLQGDIVGLLDTIGNLVVEYKYDAWGKLLSTTGIMADTLGYSNPFRYRGYIYNEETGLYYLRMRYYRPECCRFLSADLIVKAKGLYAYCSNAPALYGDWNGTEESKSESSGDITNFMREGFWFGVVNGFVEYNPLHCGYEKEDVLVMYIPYEDIQYYNNALLFEKDHPLDVIKQEMFGEAESAASDTLSEFIEKALGVGRQFSFLLTVLGIADKARKSLVENARNEMHRTAQQSETDKKTGMFVVVKRTKVWRWVMDVTNVRGGYYLGPEVHCDIKYYEKTDFKKRLSSRRA